MIYDGHRACSDLSDPMMEVKRAEDMDIYPDFITIAGGYRIAAERVTSKNELSSAYERMLSDPDEPYLLDIIVEADENVYPMIPAGGSYKEIIMLAEDMGGETKGKQGSNI